MTVEAPRDRKTSALLAEVEKEFDLWRVDDERWSERGGCGEEDVEIGWGCNGQCVVSWRGKGV